MLEGIFGKKLGMSRWFDAEGNSVPVTLIFSQGYITGRKGKKVQVGFGETTESRIGKPRAGNLKQKNLPMLKHLKEVEWLGKEEEIPEVGQKITADEFKVGEMVDIQGKSKGKGFAGVVKRWGFSGGPGGHGSRFHRAPGSIGQSSDPSRVWPGLKMAGRKGGSRVTVKNLEIVNIDPEENIIAVKGAVPGPAKSVIFLRRSEKGSGA